MSPASSRAAVLVTVLGTLVGAAALGMSLGLFGPMGGVAVPGLLAALLVVVQPVIGLLGVVAGIPVEGALMYGGATVGKALAAFVALAWIARAVLRGESFKAVIGSPVVLAVMMFLTFRVLSILWAAIPVQGLSGFVSTALLLALVILTAALVRTWDHVEWVARALVVGGTAAAILTVQQFFGGGVRRAGGDVAGGVNSTALVLVGLMPFAFYLIRSRGAMWWRLLGAGYLGIAVIAVTVTFSRMSFLMLPLVLVVEASEIIKTGRGRAMLLVLSGVAGLAVLQFAPIDKMIARAESIGPYIQQTLYGGSSRVAEVSGRGYHIRIAFAIFADHPIIGAGFENYGPLFLEYQNRVPGADRYYRNPRGAHGTVWKVLANQGLVGFVLMVVAVVVSLGSIWRARGRVLPLGRTSREFLLTRAVMLAFGIQVLYALYDEIDRDKTVWVLFGLVVVVSHLSLTAARRRSEGNRLRRPDGFPISRGGPRDWAADPRGSGIPIVGRR